MGLLWGLMMLAQVTGINALAGMKARLIRKSGWLILSVSKFNCQACC